MDFFAYELTSFGLDHNFDHNAKDFIWSNSCRSVQFSGRKRLTEQLDRALPNGFLNMEIMLSHLGVGVAYDALDGLDIHAQRLHLRHIGVAAAVRREQADIARFFQRFAEHISEMGGIAGQAGLGAFPDELVGGIPQLDGTRADIQRHRNIPDTVFGFRTADADRIEFLTLNGGAYPKGENASTLSQILQTTVLQKYYLSPKACLGILRRASVRGKELPPVLKAALERQAAAEESA